MGLGVAVECHAHDGYHFNEADLLLEVVDPKTGRVLTEGEGELVFTTLRREGTPLVRYRTHDIAKIVNEPCPCGAGALLRFGKVTKRSELVVRLADGHEIYPSLFDEVLYKLPELVDYDVTVKNNIGKERLHFLAEVTAPGENIENEMSRLLRDGVHTRGFLESGFMEEPEITTVPLGGISRMGRAKKKIEDQRVF
jgi:phenylacetate-coenzyme A ligase PaaK-like adenylate-forming protein